MDEQFDNILTNRIREVFENFDDSSANEGWLLLREKFPEEQSNRRGLAWLWWGSAAAVLLLFLGIGLWLNDRQQVKPEKLSGKKTEIKQHKGTPASNDHNHGNDKPVLVNSKKSGKSSTNQIAATNSKVLTTPQAIVHMGTENTLASNTGTSKNPAIIKSSTDSDKIIADNLTPKQPTVTDQVKPVTAKPVVTTPPPAASINSMFAKDKSVKPKGDEKAAANSKKIRFAVYATTYFNYAKGSDNQINLGAGFSSDIKLSKNLKLVTGVAIGQNTLNYTATGTPQITLSSLNKSVPGTAAAQYSAAPGAIAPVFKSYNASLVGLDIPVNLKYEFNPQKNDTYFSAGLSSGTFINESYTSHYTDPLNPSSAPQNSTTSQAFNGFYFARTLNLAFGIGAPFGKTNRLIIEPFLKYPLQGLGSQQIRFGAGGINLKLNLSSKK